MNAHYAAVHGAMLKCYQCDGRFYSEYQVERHEREAHGGEEAGETAQTTEVTGEAAREARGGKSGGDGADTPEESSSKTTVSATEDLDTGLRSIVEAVGVLQLDNAQTASQALSSLLAHYPQQAPPANQIILLLRRNLTNPVDKIDGDVEEANGYG